MSVAALSIINTDINYAVLCGRKGKVFGLPWNAGEQTDRMETEKRKVAMKELKEHRNLIEISAQL